MDRLRSYALAAPRRFAAALASATNEITRRTPAPRDFPFFALEHPQGTGAKLLERLSELGIFRIYERVLDLSSGLGGPARWLARRRGCAVFAFEGSHDRAAASRLLVRRSHLDTAVAVGLAAFARLPVRDASFTHAWSVEALHLETDKPAVFAELFRVVRPGGHVALQDWVRTPGSAPLVCAAYETVEHYLGGLRAAGFEAARSVTAEALREEQSTIAEIVGERVAEMLAEPRGVERRRLDDAQAHLSEWERALAERRLLLVQIFARRPA
ncbi:MAG TPA: class I SAM-dependent methyltransferase [Candidatus Binatia bacterium]|nr:class I SAM-dependent methyltransferase [Candidatus Binatia bacterium]